MATRPEWKWEWNLNTVVILLGFGAGLVTWGASWQAMTSGQETNARAIGTLENRVLKLESATVVLPTYELRMRNVEQRATDAAVAMQDVQKSLNGLAADMRVTREILQRLEAQGERGQR